MKLSEVAIRRPVFSTVLTLLLILFGLLSFTRLPVREYPDIAAPIVSVRTVYPGADPGLVETDVTTVLEESLSGIEGLRTLSSISREEVSTITLEFELSRDLDGAANDARDLVGRARRQLPPDIEDPVVSKANAEADGVIFLALTGDRHTPLAISDIAERVLKSRLVVLPGVASVEIDGQRRYAMRIWLDPARLAAHHLTVQDVEDALRTQNVASPSGRIESEQREFSILTRGGLSTPAQFNQLILAYRDGYPVRLEQVGRAELGAEDDRKLVRVNKRPAVGLGVMKQSKANALEVARRVKAELPGLSASLPEGMRLDISFDSSLYIERSLREVCAAMGLAVLLVVLVVYVFLGSWRATLIPAVAIPASLIGTLSLLSVLGLSLNVLTLLGFVLAIGLVVDDAIIMLENIYRRMSSADTPQGAAIEGSKEVGFAVVATTIALVVVFLPIAFLTGTIGRLFGELAWALAGAVLLSGFIAVTLTPTMCALMLAPGRPPSAVAETAGKGLAWLTERYRRVVQSSLQAPFWPLTVWGLALATSILLFLRLPGELAPYEDTGWFVAHLIAPEGSTIRYTDGYTRQVEEIVSGMPESATAYAVVGRGNRPTRVNRGTIWATLTDWDDRTRTQQDIVADLTRRLQDLPGVMAYALNPPPLNQSENKTPVQLVVSGSSYEDLAQASARIAEAARSLPALMNVDLDLDLNRPELQVEIDRNKAADLGIGISVVGRTLDMLFGGRKVTSFIKDGRAYPVIVKIQDEQRETPSDISRLHVRGRQGDLIPLRSLVSSRETAGPQELHHYEKMRSVTISASVGPGFTLGDALDSLEAVARPLLPEGTVIGYAGESKEFKDASGGLYLTFVLALLIIYLVLAAQFENVLHPLVILLSVPPAVAGALLALFLISGTLNIYSQIGLVMLIGLVSKNAILIVELANQLRTRGATVAEAVVNAACLRLRPILMTSVATILGALPLALATGAGAAGRRHIGMVIVGGLTFSTLLTLFLVPCAYSLLSRRTILPRRSQCQTDRR